MYTIVTQEQRLFLSASVALNTSALEGGYTKQLGRLTLYSIEFKHKQQTHLQYSVTTSAMSDQNPTRGVQLCVWSIHEYTASS